ncbi:MAG: cytochrome c biogenesis protein CcdA [Gammaproteobacteria bacterium]
MEWLSPLADALSGALGIAALAAIAWGMASIWMSPCHLAGVPLVVGYLAALPNPSASRRALILAFALGILLSLLPLGAASLVLGRLAGDLGVSPNYLVAGLCIAAGLYLLGWLPFAWSWGRLAPPSSRGPWAALLLGLVFGLALGPCAFAWIAPVLGIAWLQAADGLGAPTLLLVAFALGHCTGILLATGSLSLVQRWLDALGQHRGFAYGQAACGGLLLLLADFLIAGA